MTSSPTSPAEDVAPVIVALSCGWMTMPLDLFLAGEPGKVVAPATSFLIDHPKGKALFDTGYGPRVIEGKSAALKPLFHATAEDRIDKRLEEIGVDPSSVRWIINSHMHLDHAGGNCWLPEATIVVQESEWEFARAGIDRAYHPSEVETGHKVLKIRGEHDLFGDGSVVIFPTPGHTPGHQSVKVRTAAGEAVLCGDCCNLRRSLDEMRLPGPVYNAEQYMASLKLLAAARTKGATILFSHDTEQWDAITKGKPLDLSAAA